MTDPRTGPTRRSYDRVAARYRSTFEHELDQKPFDRAFLDSIASVAPANDWVVDLGCGPGQVGRYLADRGLRVIAADLSHDMLVQSGTILRDAPRVQSDMRSIPFKENSVGTVVAFYSVIHIPPTDLDSTFDELARVLTSGGYVAITVHIAPPARRVASSLRVDEMLGEPVDLDFYFYTEGDVVGGCARAGLTVVRSEERDPYPEGVETQTRRAYVLAQKPGATRLGQHQEGIP